MTDLFGLPVAAVTMSEMVELIDRAIEQRRPLRIGMLNAAKLVNMRRDPTLLSDLASSDVILADGMSVVFASRLLRQPLPERVAGIDLMEAMLRRGDSRRYRVFCLGASHAVIRSTVEHIRRQSPGVQVVGFRDGYFSEQDEPAIVRQIATAKPDILLVGITSPKKERFLAHWGEKLDIPVCHGVGGSFDVMANKVRRAPVAWQRLGLEWLHRLRQEPRRLWKRYLVTNTVFCHMLLVEMFRPTTRLPPRAGV